MKGIKDLINFGVINIDKSRGPTSFQISTFVKRSLNISKTSHMGTLDPKVTGVLPITLGRACKLASFIISNDKSYVGILHTHKECNIKDLQKIIDDNFVGKIKQTPPRKSAVKIREREREVFSFDLKEAFKMNPSGDSVDIEGDQTFGSVDSDGNGTYFLFECRVEGGTYIRKICSDLGEFIGGSHMTELRRTQAGIFSEVGMVSLDEFDSAVGEWKKGDSSKLEKMITPAEEVLKKIMPCLQVDKSAIKALKNGKPLLKSNVDATGLTEDIFALFDEDVFIGIYRVSSEEGIFARPEFVFD